MTSRIEEPPPQMHPLIAQYPPPSTSTIPPSIKSHLLSASIFSPWKWARGGSCGDPTATDIHAVAERGSSNSEFLCAVCLRDLDRGEGELECGHKFHARCIEPTQRCPLCGTSHVQKRSRSLIEKLFGIGQPKQIPASVSPQFAQTEASLSSTIRRFPSIPQILQSTPIPPPSLLSLDISLKCDTLNIDAQRGGECMVLCRISANYTLPPCSNQSMGFDGVILLDASLTGRKLSLAINAAEVIVKSASPNDRLGLVTFGNKCSIISDLFMCTTPYKQDLRKSLHEVISTNSSESFREGIKLTVNMLAKDARNGGHIFLISDGNFSPIVEIPSLITVHTIAIGGLIYPTMLRRIRRQTGTFFEFRSPSDDAPRLSQLIAYIASPIYHHSITTARTRLTYPSETKIVKILPSQYSSPSDIPNQVSLTLSSPIFTPSD